MLTTLLLFVLLGAHPFHVSVSEIKYKEDHNVIQISIRIFLDDLEETLRASQADEQLNITDSSQWETINKYIASYLLERVAISDKRDKPYELNYVGAEIEDDVMWCYLEIEKVRRLKTVKVSNNILLETYPDQENLVHFRVMDKVQSARLNTDKIAEIFTFE